MAVSDREGITPMHLNPFSSVGSKTRASMEAYRQVLQDKLKSHHENLGTIKCALEARRRWCCAEGLLKKEDRHLLTTVVQT